MLAGVFNVITGPGESGAALVAHKKVDKVLPHLHAGFVSAVWTCSLSLSLEATALAAAHKPSQGVVPCSAAADAHPVSVATERTAVCNLSRPPTPGLACRHACCVPALSRHATSDWG